VSSDAVKIVADGRDASPVATAATRCVHLRRITMVRLTAEHAFDPGDRLAKCPSVNVRGREDRREHVHDRRGRSLAHHADAIGALRLR
jgi:hypothetical protein